MSTMTYLPGHTHERHGRSRKVPNMKISSIIVEVNGYGVIGNRVADDTAATVQGLDWPTAGIPSETKGVL